MSIPAKRNLFLDTEFNERIKPFTFNPISYGLVHEDGRRYYGVSSEFNAQAAFPWLKEHVLAKLPPMHERRSLEKIRMDILEFLRPCEALDIWARNGTTDYAMLYMLFGHQMAFKQDLKEAHGIQKIRILDIQHLMDACPNIRTYPVQPEGESHHAGNDARHERRIFIRLSQYIQRYKPYMIKDQQLKLIAA